MGAGSANLGENHSFAPSSTALNRCRAYATLVHQVLVQPSGQVPSAAWLEDFTVEWTGLSFEESIKGAKKGGVRVNKAG